MGASHFKNTSFDFSSWISINFFIKKVNFIHTIFIFIGYNMRVYNVHLFIFLFCLGEEGCIFLRAALFICLFLCYTM